MYTLKEHMESWYKEKDYSWTSFWLMFGTFLDRFYANKDVKMIEEEPFENINVSKEIRAFVSASVDYLSNSIEAVTPAWTKKKEAKLEEPFFPSNLKGEIRAVMLIESPIEFKTRNIYVLGNVLSRC